MRRVWLIVLAAALAGGCKTIRADQRETLARPAMALDPEPGPQALRQHVLDTREGSVGGFGGGGGGCGCN
jgi:hypothetical protein